MNDPLRRALRTLLQFVVAGGLTALVNVLSSGLPLLWLTLVQAGNQLLVAFLQNLLEDLQKIPSFLYPESKS